MGRFVLLRIVCAICTQRSEREIKILGMTLRLVVEPFPLYRSYAYACILFHTIHRSKVFVMFAFVFLMLLFNIIATPVIVTQMRKPSHIDVIRSDKKRKKNMENGYS